MKYLLDTNIFLASASNENPPYPFDVALSFWKKFENLAKNGQFFSLDIVNKELHDHNDAVSQWCDEKLSKINFFLESKTETSWNNYTKLARWVNNKDITADAKNKFLDINKADVWLVAVAMTNTQTNLLS